MNHDGFLMFVQILRTSLLGEQSALAGVRYVDGFLHNLHRAPLLAILFPQDDPVFLLHELH
ncbi:Uncharacterised protein [Streptococcus pneumoniae]|nr:Uncharacterised protein [Streptococcus pneumoniae]